MVDSDEHPPYGFDRGKLPKGWAYPLKRSQLDAALEAAGAVERIFTVRYMVAQGWAQGQVPVAPLDVVYNGLSSRNYASGKVSITVSAVPTDQRAVVSAAILRVLADVAEWIAATAQRSATWRDTTHALYVDISDGEASMTDGSPRYKTRRN